MVADRGPDLETHPLTYKTETRQDSTKDRRQKEKTRTKDKNKRLTITMTLTQQDREKIRRNKRKQAIRKDKNIRAEEKPRVQRKANYKL